MDAFGYAGDILKVDLSKNKITILKTEDYSDLFLGGRGIAARIYWDETSPETKALEPDNCMVCMTGPLAGFTRFAGCRWVICGKSLQMEPESFSYANLGGSWGSWLKYAGFDGLVIKGKVNNPCYILITDDSVEIKDASHLWGTTTVETERYFQEKLGKDARVMSIGPAGESMVSFATVFASDNASGSSGFGSVMGSKNLKAVVIKIDNRKKPVAADPDTLKVLADQVFKLRTENYENYGHVHIDKKHMVMCHGCISGCDRQEFPDETGRMYKHFCQAGSVYMGHAMKYNGPEKGSEVNRLANRMCDQYGLDTAVLMPLLDWLANCHEAGILKDEETDLPLSKIGSREFIEVLLKKISFREGFGDILAQGTIRASQHVGKESEKYISSVIATTANETIDYDPRWMPVSCLIYATEPRRAIQLLHATSLAVARWKNNLQKYDDAFLSTERIRDIAENYWGGIDALDFTTYEGKALAAIKIQDYGYSKESLVICDLAWPIYQVKYFIEDIGFLTIESRILSAITGKEIDEEKLNRIGERIFNMQRAIFMRQGRGGRKEDSIMEYHHHEPLKIAFFDPECTAPGKGGTLISKKGTIVERDKFEMLKDEYYALRCWDVETGFQTKDKLRELELEDVAVELDKLGLLR